MSAVRTDRVSVPLRLARGVVHAVLPSGVDDPSAPSGGNVYGRRLCAALPGVGRAVAELLVEGDWPDPDAAARDRLADALASVADGADVLVDGLVACGVPDVVVPECRRLRIVVVVHLPLGDEHGLDAETAAWRSDREHAVLRAAHAVVVTSSWAAGRVTALHELPIGRVHVAPPGVDPAPLAPVRADGSSLLALGAHTRTKGHDVLVDALGALTDLRWTARISGPWRDPGYAVALREAAGRLGDRVRVTGAITGDELDDVWSDTDLLVLPSRTETYGMVVTEALARGIPVLASATGGVPETLGRAPGGGVPGLLVPPDDAVALAEVLRHWLTDANLRATARQAAHARRSRLDGWDVTARLLDGVLS
ncbi:glycosyltransferase family 4 protein [Pseudonocardia endophytica]|uniref:Glycosyltransferase involved in cell wall biosynthesis n=1 Tax=Pseudonocardia endophytica TaxID=401976 RepID=A0A4R1HWQ3_PSEEN|nr:glycosyltransferase family 4 protein [Pseudonocardia endophytica]TCK25901.1 glycosyltransferase involved in cell wall biosynthesis [Pseudonocardia endophytica]